MELEKLLNKEQCSAVLHTEGPLLILAGAGSGKTRVLTYRIAHLIEDCGVNPWSIMAITFTNKAAGEMRQRVDALVGTGAEQIWVSTFHSSCVRFLRRFADLIGYDRNFAIYDADDSKSLMKEVFQALNMDPKRFKEKSALAAISSAKDELIGPKKYAETAGSDFIKQRYAEAYAEYQRRLLKNNAMDFDDLIMKSITLFREHPEALQTYQRRFAYIMVDEYQDTNTAQFELVRLLASHPEPDGSIVHNLCVVGDDDQSIYKFRGANIQNILNFEKQFPGAAVVKLEQNYRSTGNILEAANEVIHHNTERKDKRLWTSQGSGEPISFTVFENEYEEAEQIVREIYRLVREGTAQWKDIAILYRTNAQSRIFEEKFNVRAIPYDIVNGHNFYDRKEIRDLVGYLQVIDNEADDIALRRIINVPKRGIGDATVDKFAVFADSSGLSLYQALLRAKELPGMGRSAAKITAFTEMIEGFRAMAEDEDQTLVDLMKEIIEKTGYVRELKEEGTEEAKGRIENIDELINIVAHYVTNAIDEPATLSGLMEQMKLNGTGDTEEAGRQAVTDPTDKVLLMTLHSAKGLEFPYVFLCGMEDNIFPSYMAITGDDPSELEEERRLCYVGITRAKKKLYLSAARCRLLRGETSYNLPSRFIREIPRYLLNESGTGEKKLKRPGETGNLNRRETVSYEGYGSPDRAGAVSREKKGGTGGGLFADQPLIQKGFGARRETAGAADTRSRAAGPAGFGSLAYGGVNGYSGGKKPNTKSTSGMLKAAPAPAVIDYEKGDRVRHALFGEGVVQEIEKTGTDYFVTVAFDQSGTKRMKASFARLTAVRP